MCIKIEFICLSVVKSFIRPKTASAKPNHDTDKPNIIMRATFTICMKARRSFISNLYEVSMLKNFLIAIIIFYTSLSLGLGALFSSALSIFKFLSLFLYYTPTARVNTFIHFFVLSIALYHDFNFDFYIL